MKGVPAKRVPCVLRDLLHRDDHSLERLFLLRHLLLGGHRLGQLGLRGDEQTGAARRRRRHARPQVHLQRLLV